MKEALLALFLISIVVLTTNSKGIENREIKYNRIGNEFTKENLIAYMDSVDILYPDVVLAQSELETGQYKSNIFKENNNLFGMKVPSIRKHKTIGKNRGHAVYEDWMKSVDDYKLWQNFMINNNIRSKEQYLNYLSRNYAEDKQYKRKLKKIMLLCKYDFSS